MGAYRSSALVAFSTILRFILSVNGFSVELIHRDSPKSPFYNPSLTHSDRLANAIRRSFNRVTQFNRDGPNQAESTVIMDRGEYLMELSLGTPPFPIKAVADTGSDVIWTQCTPCSDCYEQTDPLFDPKKSSTYKTIPCPSPQCASAGGTCDDRGSGSCKYSVSYGDSSHSSGDFVMETLTLGSTTGKIVPFPKTLIGCGFDNGGLFGKNGSGVVGLGGGAQSLITQLNSSVDGKFSYCLVPYDSQTKTTSTLNFGADAVVAGAGVVSTPIVRGEDPNTFYYLTLEGISVGDTKIPFLTSSPSSSGKENIVIDSGTTLTLLPPAMYQSLEDEIAKAISLKPVHVPGTPLTLCYQVGGSDHDDDFKVPTLIAHFSGADVKLEKMHTFAQVADGIMCLAFASSNLAIYGNLAQMNFLVGYDLKKQTVSFKPTDCTKQ